MMLALLFLLQKTMRGCEALQFLQILDIPYD